MPKAEKELRSDVTSLQQEVKRKRVKPGTPTDIGPWDGAVETKKREVSSPSVPQYAFQFVKDSSSKPIPQYGFQFIKSSSFRPIPQYAFQFIKNLALDIALVRLRLQFEKPKFTDVLKLELEFFRIFELALNLEDEILKNVNSFLQSSMNIQEGGKIDWYEEGVGWHYNHRTW